MPRTGEPGRTVSSRLLEVMFAFRPGRPRLTLTQLTQLTGFPYPTVRRFVMELLEAGALDRAPDGSLTVGIRLWRLGTLAPLTVPLRTAAMPFMEDLRTALDEHVQLAVREDAEEVVVERLSPSSGVPLASQIGGRLPLHAAAGGKVLLAHGGDELVDWVLGQELRRFTSQTIVDRAQLRAELQECRRTGVAAVSEELTPGVDSLSTRVLDADGHVVAALSIVVRTGTVDLWRLKPSLIASGLGISRRLGWTPNVGVR